MKARGLEGVQRAPAERTERIKRLAVRGLVRRTASSGPCRILTRQRFRLELLLDSVVNARKGCECRADGDSLHRHPHAGRRNSAAGGRVGGQRNPKLRVVEEDTTR